MKEFLKYMICLWLNELLSCQQVCDSSHKSCKRYLGIVVPPGGTNWQLICPNFPITSNLANRRQHEQNSVFRLCFAGFRKTSYKTMMAREKESTRFKMSIIFKESLFRKFNQYKTITQIQILSICHLCSSFHLSFSPICIR